MGCIRNDENEHWESLCTLVQRGRFDDEGDVPVRSTCPEQVQSTAPELSPFALPSCWMLRRVRKVWSWRVWSWTCAGGWVCMWVGCRLIHKSARVSMALSWSSVGQMSLHF